MTFFSEELKGTYKENFEQGQLIINSNKPLTILRFLVKGKAKITYIHEDGKTAIVDFVYPNEYLGELSFLNIESLHKNVRAISPCEFISIDFSQGAYLKENPEFLLDLSQRMGKKLLDRTHFYLKNQNYDLKNRLASYILNVEYKGIYKEKHTETAEYLGVSYRHLLQVIKDFLDAGYLTKIKGGFQVNLDALKVLSKEIE